MHACNDHALVMDCLLELFIRAREEPDVPKSVKAYLFKSFRQLLIQKVSGRRRLTTAFTNTFESPFEFMPCAENLLTTRHGYGIEKKGTTQLNYWQQEAIFLKFYGIFSYAEIADIMDLKVESVYNLVSNAVENLHHRRKEIVSR
jgi:DNA-directed RNA polymerase specialized sigma24 family protein